MTVFFLIISTLLSLYMYTWIYVFFRNVIILIMTEQCLHLMYVSVLAQTARKVYNASKNQTIEKIRHCSVLAHWICVFNCNLVRIKWPHKTTHVSYLSIRHSLFVMKHRNTITQSAWISRQCKLLSLMFIGFHYKTYTNCRKSSKWI